MKRRRRQIVLLGALGLVVVVVTFAVVLPKIANYRDVWAVIQTLDRPWILALAVAVVLNIVTYAPPWMLALPGLSFRHALPFTQASTALTYVAPGGGLVGMAGSYGLLRTWGFESGEVARAVTLTGVWNQLANLLLPVVGVLLLAIEGDRDAVLTTAAVVGGDRLRGRRRRSSRSCCGATHSHAASEKARRAWRATRVLRVVHRPPPVGWPDRLVAFRGETVELIRRRWQLADARRDRGEPRGVRGAPRLAARRWASARASSRGSRRSPAGRSPARCSSSRSHPVGVGPVELGLTGILVGAGGPNAAVVAAVLLYRALTILPTLLLGLGDDGRLALARP